MRLPGLACLVWIGLLGNQIPTNAAGLDFSRPPDAAGIAPLLEMPIAESAEKLRAALLEGYRPSRGALAGAASRPSYRQWMRVAQWFELLAREDREELARFLQRYLGSSERDGERQRFYRLAGSQFGGDVEPIPFDAALEMTSNSDTRHQHSERYLPEGFTWRNTANAGYLGRELADQIAATPGFLEEFLATLSPADFTPAVLANLAAIHTAHPAKFFEYQNLAVALAVVFDERPPRVWPHHQVAAEAVPRSTLPVPEMFEFWVRSNESGRLLFDLRKLGADQLKFVVDALADQSELEWAQRNVRSSRPAFGRVFSSIRYDRTRYKTSQYSWPHPGTYTLEAISKKGGLCIDQAYFAMLAGKARGLPTLFFVGQGADGGHAWFGYLKGENRWDLDCGRYENQNYAVGQALDPQSWEPITDHELLFLSQRVRRTPAFETGLADLVVADWFGGDGRFEEALGAVESALQTSPANPDAWRAKVSLLEQSGAPPAQRAEVLAKAAAQFAANRDVKTGFDLAAARLARGEGDEAAAGQIERRLISQHRRDRSDLSVGIASEKLAALVRAGDFEAAMREYRSLASRIGRTGGGNFYYDIVAPLAAELIEANNLREAARVIDIARRSLRPERGSILDNELAGWEQRLAEQRSAATAP